MFNFKKKVYVSNFKKKIKLLKPLQNPLNDTVYLKTKIIFRIKKAVLMCTKLKRLVKKNKVNIFINLTPNLIAAEKSKNARMGNGKGQKKKLKIRYESRNLLKFTNFSIIKRKLFLKKILTQFYMLNISLWATSVVVNIITILLFILIGGVIPLVERKYLSLIQRRVGPKFVGYNGRLQFLADALKILFKEIIYLINVNKFLLVAIPVLLMNINIFILLNINWYGYIYMQDLKYFILILLIIESFTNLLLTFTGILVKNKYTTIASVRLINGSVVFEIFLILIYTYIYFNFQSLSLYTFSQNWNFYIKLTDSILVLPLYIYFILINLNKVPFDLIEAETELIMGYSVEHSGFLAGALLLIEYLHLFFWCFFLAILI